MSEQDKNELINKAIELLKAKMDQKQSLSATEYWYRCGIHDAIELLKKF